MRLLRVLAAATAAVTVLAGCTTRVTGAPATVRTSASAPASAPANGPATQVTRYFTDLNAAGAKGPDAQHQFLASTQHPDFTDALCDLGGVTLHEQPALSTLHQDPDWKPEGGGSSPRGDIYVVAVTISIRRNGTTITEQIGLDRLVLLDGKVYGFAPCPTG